jgi:hypothetical protein
MRLAGVGVRVASGPDGLGVRVVASAAIGGVEVRSGVESAGEGSDWQAASSSEALTNIPIMRCIHREGVFSKGSLNTAIVYHPLRCSLQVSIFTQAADQPLIATNRLPNINHLFTNYTRKACYPFRRLSPGLKPGRKPEKFICEPVFWYIMIGAAIDNAMNTHFLGSWGCLYGGNRPKHLERLVG